MVIHGDQWLPQREEKHTQKSKTLCIPSKMAMSNVKYLQFVINRLRHTNIVFFSVFTSDTLKGMKVSNEYW